MQRVNGFINIGQILNVPNMGSYNFHELLKYLCKNNNNVVIRKLCVDSQFIFSFDYDGETYYFKYDSLVSPYNEMIFYYIASELGIPSVRYDIAKVGAFEGVISKNFKVPGAKYLSGTKFLRNFKDIDKDHNTLEDIWFDLEEYFKDKENREDIVHNIMDKLVRIFIFDLLVGQGDRHSGNWGIVKYPNGVIDLQINFDNARALINHPMQVITQMPVCDSDKYLDEALCRFQRESCIEYRELIPHFLWVISEENIKKIFALIENETGKEMPDYLKEQYLQKFATYYEFFKDFLDDWQIKRSLERNA